MAARFVAVLMLFVICARASERTHVQLQDEASKSVDQKPPLLPILKTRSLLSGVFRIHSRNWLTDPKVGMTSLNFLTNILTIAR